MNDSLYEGSHRKFFEAFLKIVDDSEAQLAAIVNSSPWKDVSSLLSVGGGTGFIEASLLELAPQASIWYLDPSEEQCDAFRQQMIKKGLLDRVVKITQTTFQDYPATQQFDQILSVFSWFYIGAHERWLT